jgi:tetratricopeptide (TPR) repeat protein
MAFAACTVVRLGDAWRSRRREEGYILAAVVAVIFLVAHFQKDQSATIQEANVHYNEGNLWSGKGNHEMAIREFRRALAMDDSRYETWFNLGNSLRAIGRPAEAADAYESSATRRPRFFNAHLRRAQELEEAGDWAGASAAYRKAEELRADDFEVQLGMGRAEARLGDHAEAIRHLDRALQLRPGDPAAAAERARL